MPKCYQLIGVPGSGKTTWCNNQDWTKDCQYISTDKWIDTFARERGETYSQVFQHSMSKAVRLMTDEIITARSVGQDIIWDQTSVTVASRKKKFSMLPRYEHIAVVFRIPEPEELARRLASRPGKNIPSYVIDSMIRNFEMPTESEDFKEIWYTT